MTPYETLGVDPDASDRDIKSAYRQLARVHHPDRSGDAEQFKNATEAYEVLSDSDRRKRYDETGDTEAAPGIEQEIRMIIAGMVSASFAQEKMDPVRFMCQQIDVQRQNFKEQLRRVKISRDKLTQRLEQFEKANADTDNIAGSSFLISQLHHTIKQLNQNAANLESSIETGTKALEFLNDLACPVEGQKVKYVFRSSGDATGSWVDQL